MTTGIGILPPDPVFTFKENMGHIHSLCFPIRNPDYCDLLLVGNEKGDVYFWDLESNRLQLKQNMGESIQSIHSIGYDIITQEKSGLVKLWSIENKSGYRIQKSFQCNGGFCRGILFDNQLMLPQEKGQVDAVNIETFETVNKFVPDKSETLGNVMCLEKVAIRGIKFVLVGYESGDIILYDYSTAKLCCQMKFKEFTNSVAFDSNTLRGVIANSSNTLQIFRIDPECFEITLEAELNMPNEGCQIVRFRPDKKLMIAGGWDGRLRVYSWKTLRVLAILTQHKKQVSDIQFSPNVVRYWDSKIIATGGADGAVMLWNIYHSY